MTAGTPREALKRLAQITLAVIGLGLIAALVRNAGPEKVARVLLAAAWWLPLIVALEIAQMASDIIVLRHLLGARGPLVPASTWVRTSAISYAMMILVPTGRAAGEVTRGALIARHTGASWAATAGAQLQAAYLFANAALSVAALVAVASWWGAGSTLALLLAGNIVLMIVFSASILAVLRGDRTGRWIEGLRQRFMGGKGASSPPLEPGMRRRLPWRAAGVCAVSRTVQVLQYGVILAAVGGTPSVHGAFVAHGIHLVGTTAGDLLPNQLGAVDGAYRAFASAIGLSGDPARALSIAFVAHLTQLLCAAGCIVVAVVTRRGESINASTTAPAHGEDRASARANARS
jgi:hypothetical protein